MLSPGDLIQQVIEGADPERLAEAILTERKRAPLVDAFHGTSYLRWQDIKRNGLKPSSPKVWGFNKGQVDEPSTISVGGIYLSSFESMRRASKFNAFHAALKAHRADKSWPVLIHVRIQPRQASVDEDEIKALLHGQIFLAVLREQGFRLNDRPEYGDLWGRFNRDSRWRNKIETLFAVRAISRFSEILEGRGYAGEVDPRFWDALTPELMAFFRAELGRRVALVDEEAEKPYPEFEIMWGNTPPPDVQTANAAWRDAIGKVGDRFRRFQSADKDLFDNFRFTEPIDFRGRNRIVGAIGYPHKVSQGAHGLETHWTPIWGNTKMLDRVEDVHDDGESFADKVTGRVTWG